MIPKKAKKLSHTVLAEGEATGHSHRATGGVLYADDDDLWLVTEVPVEIEHEEHDTQTLAPGTMRIGRVREMDHFAEEARRVTD